MVEAMKSLLLRVLRVPADPQPPAGDAGPVLTFRASRYYFGYRAVLWAFKQLSAFAALFAGAMFLHTVASRGVPYSQLGIWGWLELWAWATFVLQLPFSFLLMRLDFEMRWYLLGNRSLRIREGMLTVREKTMTYANIQNISIRRNPLQRLFGLATVAVRAAGGGSGGAEGKGGHMGSHTHEALFEGVDNADAIREILRDHIRRHRDSGLGDPDDDVEHAQHVSPALAAAHELLVEARALRTAARAQLPAV